MRNIIRFQQLGLLYFLVSFLISLALSCLAIVESHLGQNGSIVEVGGRKKGSVSPGHNDSPRGMICTWSIKAPERHSVILKMNELDLDGGCDHIRHGKNLCISLLKKFRGQKGESSMFSSGHYLCVQVSFKSDAPGFEGVEKGKRQNY